MQEVMKIFFLLIYFFLPGFTVYAKFTPGSDTAYINKLNASSFSLIKEEPDSSWKLAEEAIQLSEKANYLHGLGDGYMRLGIIEKDRGNYQQAIRYYKISLSHRIKIGDKDLIARVYNNIGLVFSRQTENDSAAFYLLKALAMAESLKLKSAEAMYSMNLGIAYRQNDDFELASKYNENALDIYRAEGDSAGVLKSLINKGGILHSEKNYYKALSVYRAAISLAEFQENDREKHLAMGDLALIFMNLDQHDSAAQYMLAALEYHKEEENDPAVAIDMSNLGILYRNMNRPDSALWYLNESLKLAEELGNIKLASDNAEELSEIYSNRGDFKQALNFKQLFITYNDSVYSLSKAEAIAEMQTKYETEKKEKEILVLNKDREIQAQKIRRKNMMQIFLLSGFVLVIIISFLFFNRFKLKKKIENQEALLNERKRISSELHDDLGAQLSTARMFLSKLKNSNGIPENHTIIDNSLNLIDGSISDLRRIMDDLQVSTLQDKGIIAATEELVNKINQLQQINFVLSHHGIDKRLTYKTEHSLFRITQELINNTLKYANAKNVTLEFLCRDNNVILLYEDDGKGFDLNTVKRGYGLSNIESRAGAAGGSADFDSQVGKGSRTIIEIPLPVTL